MCVGWRYGIRLGKSMHVGGKGFVWSREGGRWVWEEGRVCVCDEGVGM